MSLSSVFRKSSPGQSLIEVALIFPFLLAIFFGALEFGQIFFKYQRASSLSREIALAAFRDCGKAANLTPGPAATSCLNNVRTQMKAIARIYFRNFNSRGDIIVSLYGRDTVTSTFIKLGTAGGTGNYATRFNLNTVPHDKGNIAIAELYYDIPLLTPLQALLSMTVGNIKNIYQATMV